MRRRAVPHGLADKQRTHRIMGREATPTSDDGSVVGMRACGWAAFAPDGRGIAARGPGSFLVARARSGSGPGEGRDLYRALMQTADCCCYLCSGTAPAVTRASWQRSGNMAGVPYASPVEARSSPIPLVSGTPCAVRRS